MENPQEKPKMSNEMLRAKNIRQMQLAKELFKREKGFDTDDDNHIMFYWGETGYSEALQDLIDKRGFYEDPDRVNEISLEDLEEFLPQTA
jgi:hypothetical protein